jgi:DNA-directed RNA polymerase specialized sigma24 family protein
MLKQFLRQPAQDDHESLFMRLYDQLLRQATKLAGDAAQAEDLLHDAFINFTLRRPELERLHNVEGYLLFRTYPARLKKIRVWSPGSNNVMRGLSIISFDTSCRRVDN